MYLLLNISSLLKLFTLYTRFIKKK